MHRPSFVTPCAPVRSAKVPRGNRWIHEPKLDGWRLLAIKEGDNVRLLTRRQADYTDRLPSIAAAVLRVPGRSLILDGELCAVDAHGAVDFYGLQAAMRRSHGASGLAYYVFDCLHRDGRDLVRLPLRERRKELERAIPRARLAPLFRVDQYRDGEALFAACESRQLEGVVSKRVDRPYTAGASRDWLKTKCAEWVKVNAARWKSLGSGK